MIILLPPSETKTPAPAGDPVDLGELSFPELSDARETVVDQLQKVSASPDALEQLKVGKTLAAEVQRNTRLYEEPAHAASQVYTGVLFDALDLAGFSGEDQGRAHRHLLVISALWGAVRPGDRIPAYRLSMGTSLGEIGSLKKFWRGELAGPLDAAIGDQLVLDCRSADYAQAYRPRPAQTLAVRVEKENAAGQRTVVSHMAKHYRGLLARAVISQQLTDIDDAAELVERLSPAWRVELTAPTEKKAGVLTVVVREESTTP